MEKEKYIHLRGQYIPYDDSPIALTPRNHLLEATLSALRAAGRIVWFVLACLGLSLIFAAFVQPAKLMAVLRTWWQDLRTLKMTEDNM